jgi:hypothetical protein
MSKSVIHKIHNIKYYKIIHTKILQTYECMCESDILQYLIKLSLCTMELYIYIITY